MKRKSVLISSIFVFALSMLLFVTPVSAQNSSQTKFTLTPNNQSVNMGQNLIVTVYMETGAGNGTNSYILNLSYPQNKLTFVSIDTSKSPFDMGVEAKGGDGQVNIVRGTTKTQSGKLLAGTVTFKAKAQTKADEVTVTKSSAIIRSSDNTNILPGSVVQKNSPVPSHQGMPNSGSSFFDRIYKFFSSLFR